MDKLIDFLANEIKKLIENNELIKPEKEWLPEKIGDKEISLIDRMINPKYTILINALLTLSNAYRMQEKKDKINFAA